MKKFLFFSSLIITISLLTLNGLAQNEVTLTLRPGPGDSYDTYINSVYYMADANSNLSPNLVACAYTYNGDFGIGRSLLRFDLSKIPANASVVSATLDLYYDPAESMWYNQLGNNACYLKRITSSWSDKSVTWNSQPSYTETNQVLLPASDSLTQNYTGLDVTNLIRDMISNQNWGFGLIMIDESPYTSMIFASGDNTNEALRPRLSLKYAVCQHITHFTWTFENLTCNFHDTTSASKSWFWDFGDGYSSSLPNPQHTYSSEGVYHVSLLAGNDCGTDTVQQVISLCKPLIHGFNYSYSSNRMISFNDSSTVENKRLWDFGDGYFSNLQNPVHNYLTDGTFTVRLVKSNDCQVDTCYKDVLVNPTSGVENAVLNGIILSPNPSDKEFTLEFPEGSSEIFITVFDNMGKQVYKTTKLKENRIITIPSLKSGIYTIFMNNSTFAGSYRIVSIKQ